MLAPQTANLMLPQPCQWACIISSWSQVHRVVEDDFELLLLPLLPKCWDYRHAPTHTVYEALGIKPWALCLLEKYLLTKL